MIRARLVSALLVAVILLPTPAAAHMPYFSGTPEAVALPGGESGAIRLLYGDGILDSDPVRPIVTDAGGGVRAITPVGYAASYSCAARSCRVYLYRDTMLLPRVFDTDIETMKASAVLRTADENDLDAVMRTREPFYGFRHVPDLGARIVGALVCLAHWWDSFVILMLIGATAIPVLLLVRMALGRREENRWGAMTLCILFVIGISIPVAVILLMFLFVSAYPLLLSLVPLGLPTAVLLATFAGRSLWGRGHGVKAAA
jgi:hypothetical protein